MEGLGSTLKNTSEQNCGEHAVGVDQKSLTDAARHPKGSFKGSLKDSLKGSFTGSLKGSFKGSLKGLGYKGPCIQIVFTAEAQQLETQ